MNLTRFTLLFTCLMTFVATGSVTAAGLLSNEEAQSADPELLMSEVAVFKSIRQAMTLSHALCETSGNCKASASPEEVEKVIEALDSRVEGLGLRQQEAGNSAGLEDVIVAYANERGGLSRVLKKAGSMNSAVVENIEESELFGSDDEAAPAAESGGAEQFSDMFADEDEEL